MLYAQDMSVSLLTVKEEFLKGKFTYLNTLRLLIIEIFLFIKITLKFQKYTIIKHVVYM